MIFWIFFFVALTFGLVLFRGAPYLPTMKGQTEMALELFDLPKGATILELGSGDGRVARHFAIAGYRVVGYELNPILWMISLIWTWRYRGLVKIHLGDYWRVTWPEVDGVYVFLLDRFMLKLDEKIEHDCKKDLRLISYAFKIPGKRICKERNGFFVYDYNKKRKR